MSRPHIKRGLDGEVGTKVDHLLNKNINLSGVPVCVRGEALAAVVHPGLADVAHGAHRTFLRLQTVCDKVNSVEQEQTAHNNRFFWIPKLKAPYQYKGYRYFKNKSSSCEGKT